VSPRMLLKSGCILTLGAKTPNYSSADVLIDDGIVTEVGTGLSARGAEVIDAADAIVMPGFVDTHRHVWKSLFRNHGDADGAIDASRLSSDDVYAATYVGLLGAIEAGVTTVVDWADVPEEQAHLDAALRAHADAGLRTVFVQPDPDVEPMPPGSLTTLAYRSADVGVGADAALDGAWAAARKRGLRIHAHAGIRGQDRGSVAALAGRGMLGEDVTLVHGTHLSDADLDAVASSGTSLVVAPSAEMATGLGPPPLQKFLDRKIEPGLAVDDERVAPGDLLAQMRVTNSLQHAAYFDLKLAGKAGLPNLLTTRDVIRYATTVGARAIGLDRSTGRLDPGMQADLIVLRTDRPNIYPINDPIGAVVWGVDTSNIDWVFVAGRPLLREGSLGADVAHARELVSAAQRRLGIGGGMLAGSTAGDPA